MAEPFSFSKFFSGFNIFSGATLGKILFQMIIWVICGGIVWGIFYKAFIKDTNTSHIDAPQATAIYKVEQPKVSNFGCNNYKVLEYMSKR